MYIVNVWGEGEEKELEQPFSIFWYASGWAFLGTSFGQVQVIGLQLAVETDFPFVA